MTLNLKSPDLLFHYTSRATALEHILSEGRLKIGPLRFTNDPREANTWKFRVNSSGKSLIQMFSLEELYQISHETSDYIIKHGVKTLCLTQNVENKPAWERPRMWAQYGDRHQGVCIALHKEKLGLAMRNDLGKNVEIYHDFVRYSDLSDDYEILTAFDLNLNIIEERGFDAALSDQRKRFYHEFFLTKHNDWTDEAEYRWICFTEDDDPRFVDIQGALVAVIVGVDFPGVYNSCLPSLCERFGAHAGKVQWENGYPRRVCWDIYQPT